MILPAKILFFSSFCFCLIWLQTGAYAQSANPTLSETAAQTNYTSISEIVRNCGLTPFYDALSGKVRLQSPDKENPTIVVIAPGMEIAMVDGERILLPARVSLSASGMKAPLTLLKIIQERIAAKREAAARKEKIEPPPPPEKKELKKVVIDPGHGGKFPGATGWGQVEANINLAIALKLKNFLESAGIKVVMTRQSDTYLAEELSEDLDARVNLANREQPDIFVSIHTNASRDKSATGFEVFLAPVDEDVDRRVAKAVREDSAGQERFQMSGSLPPQFAFDFQRLFLEEYYRQSRQLASDIVGAMAPNLPEPNRGVKEEGFRVIKWTRCPAVLVEVGFITNRETAQKLSRSQYRASIAEAIAQGILNFKKRFDRTEGFTKSGQDESEKPDSQTGSLQER